MKKNCGLALLLILSLSLPLLAASDAMGLFSLGVSTVHEESFVLSETFTENFADTTYLDAGNTDASGWGDESITLQRVYNIELLDYYNVTAGPVKSLDVQGRKAYLGVYNPSIATDSLRILDISDPTSIAMIGRRNSAHLLCSCAVDGDIAVVGTDTGWFAFYNVSNPTAIPGPTFSTTLDGNVTALDFEGKFLYVGLYGSSSGKGLLVYDIEDPYTPVRIQNSYIFSKVLDLDVEDQIAFVADDTYGLFIENLTNPYEIDLIGQVNTNGNTADVLVDGSYAYLADGYQGIQVVDIQAFSTASIIGTYNTSGFAQKVAIQGNTLFVADGSNGVVILDVSDPTNPSYVDKIDLPYTYDVDMYGEVLLVSTEDGVYSYKVSSVASLPLVGILDGYNAKDVVVQGHLAYVAAGTDGLLTIDVSNPANPVLLDRSNHSNSVNYVSIDVQGHHAYVTSVHGILPGLLSFDVSDPTSIVFLNRLGLTYPYDVCVAGDVACVADGIYGMYLVNTSDPSDIVHTLVIKHDIENYTAVDMQGHFIYAVGTGSPDGLYIYDATDLLNLVIADTFGLTYLSDVRVEGDYVFAADGPVGGWCLNVTDPHNLPLVELDYYDRGDYTVYGVDMVGRYMLMAERNGGVHLLNGSDQSNLQLIASYGPSATIEALRVTAAGDYAYVAAGDSLVILRLFNSPGATFETSNVAQSLAIATTTTQIENATLTQSSVIPVGSSITWKLSADGGAHWQTATPGVELSFDYPGNDLRWRAELTTTADFNTPIINSLQVVYEVNAQPSTPELNDPGTTDNDGNFMVSWNASIDDGAIINYTLEMSSFDNFSIILENWTTSTLNQSITGLTNGNYYFRVRALDDNGAYSDWSSTESIEVDIPTSTTTTTTTTSDTNTNTGTTITSPFDNYLLMIIIAAVGVLVVVIIIVTRKKS